MVRGRRKLLKSKRTLPQITLLLVIFALSKIGQIPILLVRSCWFIVHRLILNLSKLKLPHYHLPTIKYQLFHRRRRGRPRQAPLILYHLRSTRLYIRHQIPKKLKVAAALAFFLSIFFGYTYFTIQTAQSLPSPTRLISTNQPLTTEFYDRKGELLYRLYEGRNRTLIQLNNLPSHLIWATIAAEDKNFYRHQGFDLAAMLRAFYTNLKTGQLQGASTITQQLVKNSLLTPEKTISRKIKEIFLSFWAERIYSKDEILQMYFNEAPYGGPAWGIEAASLMYFGKSAKDLNLAESTFLAGLPASPTRFSPLGSEPHLAKERQSQVLGQMVELGFISQNQVEEAQNQQLEFKIPTNQIKAPHFVMFVRDLLSQKYGARVVSQGGLKIQTTLDLNLQEAVEEIVKEEVTKLLGLNVQNGAAMVTDAKTGQILAMVGSKDYHQGGFGNYNVTLALRQPGSAIKPITYATAFKQGFSPGNTILDTPVRFGGYSPINYDGSFHGPVSARVALGSSYNIPAVRVLATVGIENMIKTARDLGITTFDDSKRFGLSLTLGGGEVKMIDMMAVYGTLSQAGVKHQITPILKVEDSLGNILEEYSPKEKRVLQEEIAYLLTSILSDNNARTPAFGPNSQLHIPPHQVAVKTGTSDNKRDNWTFGYTPAFVVGVWVGNNDNSLMHPTLSSGVTGAAPIWNKITRYILQKQEPVAFKRPEGVIEATIDGRRDLAVAGILPKGLTKVIKDGDKLVFSDAFTTYATFSAQALHQNEFGTGPRTDL